jgi:hypothetical protein
MARLSFDPNAPPLAPPAECGQPLLWRVSRALWQAHQPATDGFCIGEQCRAETELWPCRTYRLAVVGLLASLRKEPAPGRAGA